MNMLQVYRTKLCIDRQNVTIDLSDHDSDSLTITIETDVAYTGVGMLVEISGQYKDFILFFKSRFIFSFYRQRL